MSVKTPGATLLLEALGGRPPVAGMILGSGLGDLTRRATNVVAIPFGSLSLPQPSVDGHAGRIVCGDLCGARVVIVEGRVHYYEGHDPHDAAAAVRLLSDVGMSTLLLVNAAGGIRGALTPGSLMVIADHINVAWRNPLIGPLVSGDTRFPDMSEPYDPELRRFLHESARDAGIPLADGVYAAVLGPSYETPVEIRMLARIGADAVGMSTVPEVLAARARGVRVAGVSVITNHAAGLSPEPLSHGDVLAASTRAAASVGALAEGFIARLSAGAVHSSHS